MVKQINKQTNLQRKKGANMSGLLMNSLRQYIDH